MAPRTSINKQYSIIDRNTKQQVASNNQKDKRIMEDERPNDHTWKCLPTSKTSWDSSRSTSIPSFLSAQLTISLKKLILMVYATFHSLTSHYT